MYIPQSNYYDRHLIRISQIMEYHRFHILFIILLFSMITYFDSFV